MISGRRSVPVVASGSPFPAQILLWQQPIAEALRQLSLRPGVLFTVLWAVNALARPYTNLVHDARLYGLQVQNRVMQGAFGDDLFLRFGSQDQYTPFSRLAAPIVRLLGLEPAFFLFFLVCNALLILSIQRLVAALLEDRVLSTLALIFVVMQPLSYGGIGVFHVNEPFFTPRLLSCALAIFALEQILRRRYASALCLSVVATIAHPLMGVGALLIAGICATFELPRRYALGVLGVCTAIGLAILGYRPMGTRLFGTMDSQWVEIVRSASPYNFPLLWAPRDWINVIGSVTVALVTGVTMLESSPERARLVLVTATACIVGTFAMIVASEAPYRVLLQGQPYRVVWILKVMEIPLAFWLARHLWFHGRWLAAVLLVGYCGLSGLPWFAAALPAAVFAVVSLTDWPRRPVSSAWLVRSASASLVVGVLAWGLVRAGTVVALRHELLELMDPVAYGLLLAESFSRMFWLIPVLWILAVAWKWRVSHLKVAAIATAIVLVAHTSAMAIPRSYRAITAHGSDEAFVRHYFAEHHPTDRASLTVYDGAGGYINLIWFELGTKSYFQLDQVAGVLFSRDTAIEARRRAAIVRPLEVERYQTDKKFMPQVTNLINVRLLETDRDALPPTEDDVRRLCRPSEHLDVAILRRNLGGLAAASNGRVFIYECAQLRLLT